MALIDVFLQVNVAQEVLFLADRDALGEQAETDGFQTTFAERAASMDLV